MEYWMSREDDMTAAVTSVSSRCWKPEHQGSMLSSDSFCASSLKMQGKILVLLFFLGGTLAMKIGVGENRDLRVELKMCLATVIEKVCPDCITGHIVIPSESAWETHALISHFTDSLSMHAMTIYTMDRPGYKDPLVDQVGLYLVNSEADLTMALKHLRETNSKRNCVIWVNFYFGRSLQKYLKSTTPATWNRGRGWSIIFVGQLEGDVQVFGTPIQYSRSSNVQGFKNLSLCDTKALIEVPQPLPKVIQIQESIIRVTMGPSLLPYVQRKTDNPGGYFGELMNVLKSRLHFTPKYVWPVTINDFHNFAREDGLRMYFNLYASPKKGYLLSPSISMVEGVWMIATLDSSDKRNFLVVPFKNSIFLHIALLAIYAGIMVCLIRDFDKTRILLRFFGIFFGIGIGWFPRKPLSRFLVLLWCFTSYILVQTYLAALTSELSSPATTEIFHNAEDLMNSGIKMFCGEEIKRLYCNLTEPASVYICKGCVLFDEEFMRKILSQKLNMKENWHQFAVTLDTRITKTHFAKKPFMTMPERIGAWPAGVSTNVGTEFFLKMTNITERLHEAGISEYWLTRYGINRADAYESEHEMLNMSHLNDVFTILYGGWSCSIVVFVIEILTKRYYSR